MINPQNPAIVSPAVSGDLLHYIDSSALRPGDILLCTNPKSLRSKVIRGVTFSRYSHAAIFIGDGEFVEAIGSGVRRSMIDVTAVRNRKNVRFLRLKDQIPNAQSIAEVAGRKAENYVARRYWLPGACAVPFPGVNLKRIGKFFCSQLVAQAYCEAGLELLDGISPHKVKPGRLLRSPHLVDITDEILLPPEPAKRWRPADLLDGETRTTMHDGEVAVRQIMDDRARSVFRKEGIEIDGGFDSGLKFLWQTEDEEQRRRLDQALVEILREEGYDALPATGQEKLDASLQQLLLVERMIDANEPLEKLAEIRRLQLTLQKYLDKRLADERPVVGELERLAENTGCEVFQIKADVCRAMLDALTDVGFANMLTIVTLEEGLLTAVRCPRVEIGGD